MAAIKELHREPWRRELWTDAAHAQLEAGRAALAHRLAELALRPPASRDDSQAAFPAALLVRAMATLAVGLPAGSTAAEAASRAVVRAQAALQIHPESATARRVLALALYARACCPAARGTQRYWEAAQRQLARFDDLAVLAKEAELYAGVGDPACAQRIAAEAANRSGAHWIRLRARCALVANGDDPWAAVALLREALAASHAEDDTDLTRHLLRELAALYERIGATEAAAACLKEGVLGLAQDDGINGTLYKAWGLGKKGRR